MLVPWSEEEALSQEIRVCSPCCPHSLMIQTVTPVALSRGAGLLSLRPSPYLYPPEGKGGVVCPADTALHFRQILCRVLAGAGLGDRRHGMFILFLFPTSGETMTAFSPLQDMQVNVP